MNQEMINFLVARKSIRKYDPTQTISDETINKMLTLAATAPSSNNAQPWKVVVIKDKAKLKALRSLASDQEQVETASALFFILGDLSAYQTPTLTDFSINHGLLDAHDQAAITAYQQGLENFYQTHPEDKTAQGVNLDTGLFAMNLMHVVRCFGYDSVAMRGVDFPKVMDYLNIDSHLIPIMFLSVGIAAEQGNDKQRYPVSDFTQIIE